MIRQYVIQRGDYGFWTGHDWARSPGAALLMTLTEAADVMDRHAEGSPVPLHLIKDYGTAEQCVLCTA